MAEYDTISKTALLRHLDMAIECKDCPRNTDRKTYYDRCGCSEVADICNTITDFATFADVQPVKHGRWTDNVYKYVISLDAYFIQAKCTYPSLQHTDHDYVIVEIVEVA